MHSLQFIITQGQMNYSRRQSVLHDIEYAIIIESEDSQISTLAYPVRNSLYLHTHSIKMPDKV